jgi:hypothetical protein
MPRRLVLPAVLFALSVAGCAHQQAALPGYSWAFLDNADEPPKLAYGRPSSDEVLLMMTCAPGSRAVTLSASGVSGRTLSVSSGGRLSRFAAVGGSDGGLLEAEADRDALALGNFRRTGDLAIVNAGRSHSISAVPADRGQVAAFFKACEA